MRGEIGADFRGDGEAGRHRQAQIAHFGQVRALAAEQILHLRAAFRRTAAKGINPFRHGLVPLETCAQALICRGAHAQAIHSIRRCVSITIRPIRAGREFMERDMILWPMGALAF